MATQGSFQLPPSTLMRLRRVALATCGGNVHDAEDAIQETYVRLLTGAVKLPEAPRAAAAAVAGAATGELQDLRPSGERYLTGVVRNVARAVRRESHRLAQTDPGQLERVLQDRARDSHPGTPTWNSARAEEFASTLSGRQKQAYGLLRDGLGPTEAARQLEMHRRDVYKLYRALTKKRFVFLQKVCRIRNSKR